MGNSNPFKIFCITGWKILWWSKALQKLSASSIWRCWWPVLIITALLPNDCWMAILWYFSQAAVILNYQSKVKPLKFSIMGSKIIVFCLHPSGIYYSPKWDKSVPHLYKEMSAIAGYGNCFYFSQEVTPEIDPLNKRLTRLLEC